MTKVYLLWYDNDVDRHELLAIYTSRTCAEEVRQGPLLFLPEKLLPAYSYLNPNDPNLVVEEWPVCE